jgi:hypothetical protein
MLSTRRFLLALVLAAISSGCASTFNVDPSYKLPTVYSGKEPIEAEVSLLVDEFFETYVWNYELADTYRAPLGRAMARQAEVVARSAFSSVKVIKDKPPSDGVVLIPEVIKVMRSSPAHKATTAILIRWKLRKNGDVVWETEQGGMGRGYFGNPFTVPKHLHEQLEAAMGEAFRNSYEAILDSAEVRRAL